WEQMYVAPATDPGAFSYAAKYQAGPWSRVLSGLWILTPLNLVLGSLATVIALLPSSVPTRLSIVLRPGELGLLRLCSGITILMVLIIIVMPLSQNFRYLAPIYGPMYIVGGIGLSALVQPAFRLQKPVAYACAAVLAMASLGSAVSGYRDFEVLFVQ